MKHYMCSDLWHTCIYTSLFKCTKYIIICILLCIEPLVFIVYVLPFLSVFRPIYAGFLNNV